MMSTIREMLYNIHTYVEGMGYYSARRLMGAR